MSHIFISYARKDTRQLALDLADALSAVDGITAWVDRSLRAGKSWELQIQAQIDRCDVMVVLYSPEINRHKNGEAESYVLTEIAYAKYTAKKPIIPVMAQRTEAPISLTMEHYIDYTIDGVTLDDLVAAVCAEIDVAAAAPTPGQQTPPPAPARTQGGEKTPRIDTSTDAVRAIIGGPFEWCEVPAGEFVYGEGKRLALPAFAMAKYPVTYRQFQAFIDAKDGYHDPRWWEGLAAVPDHREQPGEQEWKLDDHPRENVSWYEAMAFARWLSYKLGGGTHIDDITQWAVRLPTEFEWEKAARGTDGRVYPWGNNFNKKRCNTRESGIMQTTSAIHYTTGASPYGVMDMTGNVWEWCMTDYERPALDVAAHDIRSDANRVLRGGSFNFNASNARTTARLSLSPDRRSNRYGFRICRPGDA